MSSIVIPFIGGLAMFIYGMNIMADGLQHAAGSKMKKILEVLTQNKLMGIALGALVTAIIQSSSATTVMVVGFVNAGLMNLTQAISVIMGANIGTTITGWLVSAGEWAKMFSYTGTNRGYGRRNHNAGGEKAAKQGCSRYHHWVWYPFYRHEYHVRCGLSLERIRGI